MKCSQKLFKKGRQEKLNAEQVQIMANGIYTPNLPILSAVQVTLMNHSNNFALVSNFLLTQIALIFPTKKGKKLRENVSSTFCQDGNYGRDDRYVNKTVNGIEMKASKFSNNFIITTPFNQCL